MPNILNRSNINYNNVLYIMKKIFTILIILGVSIAVQAQTMKAFTKEAEKAMLDKDYYTALEHYKSALDIKPESVELQYKVAESARLFSAYTMAETYYKSVLDSKEASNYPMAQYYLGMVQISEGKYEDAKTNLSAFSASGKSTDEKVLAEVTNSLKDIEFATAPSLPKQENCKLTKLDETVNSEWNDFAPSLINGKLYFTSLRFLADNDKRTPPKTYAGVLEKEGEQIAKRVNIPGAGGTLHFAHSAINHKRDKIYFTICEYQNSYDIRCDLYEADYSETGFGNPKKLENPINADGFTTTQPALSYDEKTKTERLFFVSDRSGGKGNKDIWYVDINSSGQWGSPVNLVAINTVEDEITPNYHAPSNTLYFSSDGYTGFGGYDVFSTTYKNNVWSKPANLGDPINTSRNDLYYWINETEDTAYFASNRESTTYLVKEKNACCNDIFLAKYAIINLKAFTFESANKAALNGCKVSLYELTPQGRKFIAEITDPETNLSKFRLMPNKDYRVIAEKAGFNPDSALVTTKGVEESKDIVQNLYLKPAKIDLNLFTFDDATKQSLSSCKVQLFDITGGKNDLLFEKLNPNANDFNFSLDPCKKYRVVVSHNGYTTYTEEFETPCDGSAKSIRKDVYLKRMSLEDYLPLAVYFENDAPDKKSISKNTTVDYQTTFDKYYPLKEKYTEGYCFSLKSTERVNAEKDIAAFFETNVKKGKDSLDIFTQLLLEVLKNGETIKLKIEGYASPLASTAYNKNLSSRRIKSVINHFKKYDNGVLKPYLKSGALKLVEVSYGETRANRSVSDNRKDKRKSIYSPDASRERRSRIIDVTRETKESKTKK